MIFHLFSHPAPDFIHHIDRGTKIIRLFLPRDLEMREDEGFLFVLVQIGVLLSKGFPEAGILLLHHSEHGLPVILVAENGLFQIIEEICSLVVQIVVQQ